MTDPSADCIELILLLDKYSSSGNSNLYIYKEIYTPKIYDLNLKTSKPWIETDRNMNKLSLVAHVNQW